MQAVLGKVRIGVAGFLIAVGANAIAVAQEAGLDNYEVVIIKYGSFFGIFDPPVSFSDLDRIAVVSLHIASDDVPDALKVPIDVGRQLDLCGPFYSPIGYIKREQYRIYFSNNGHLCLGWMQLIEDIDENEVERWNQLLIETRREVVY